MQFKNNKTIEMQCGHKNQVGMVDLHELIQSANNKGLFVNVSIYFLNRLVRIIRVFYFTRTRRDRTTVGVIQRAGLHNLHHSMISIPCKALTDVV